MSITNPKNNQPAGKGNNKGKSNNPQGSKFFSKPGNMKSPNFVKRKPTTGAKRGS